MDPLYLFTLFCPKTDLPVVSGLKLGSQLIIKELYRKGSGRSLYEIETTVTKFRDIILKANLDGRPIITSDFKNHLTGFKLPKYRTPYNVYDLHLPDLIPQQPELDARTIQMIIAKFPSNPPAYHKIIANAAVVYQELEETGVYFGAELVHPKWLLKTYSGRSKTQLHNLQGATADVYPVGLDNYVFLHFDWICADIRVASLFSQDELLLRSFLKSDPYEAMVAKFGNGITRDECKTHLLRSINAMDLDSLALTEIYPQLGNWIRKCRELINTPDGYLKSLLGRKFKLGTARNQLSVLNGVMQGSVAHAMQLVVRKLWEAIGTRLVGEIHDSLVVVAPPTPAEVKRMIDCVVTIMAHPFADHLPDNPLFPLKVSIGRAWRQWRPYMSCRNDRMVVGELSAYL